MKLRSVRTLSRKPQAQKLAASIIVLSIVELALLALVVAQSLAERDDIFSLYRLPAISALAILVAFDVLSSIYTARTLRRWQQEVSSVQDSLAMVEQLNGTLRAQRHDFLNHLQVVYGLIEMNEFSEAADYIHRVSADIQDVSRVLRTKNAAVNALLQAKYAMCQKQGVAFDMVIKSQMDDLPIEDWQMCRVLSNLIDNAVEAMRESATSGVLRLVLEQDAQNICFRVENNGPAVPDALVPSIFSAGVSTKGDGRGTGLSIVRQVLREGGGDIAYRRSGDWTIFEGILPRAGTKTVSSTVGS